MPVSQNDVRDTAGIHDRSREQYGGRMRGVGGKSMFTIPLFVEYLQCGISSNSRHENCAILITLDISDVEGKDMTQLISVKRLITNSNSASPDHLEFFRPLQADTIASDTSKSC